MACQSILIVEDDPDIRDSLRMVLELEGYEVRVASNGREGLEVLSTMRRPSLILLDLTMPVMNGWQFLCAQRLDDVIAAIPVVVVSAAVDAPAAAQCDAFMRKPVHVEALLRTVRRHCHVTAVPAQT